MKLKKIAQAVLRRAGYDVRWIPPVLGRRPEAQLRVSLEMVIARQWLEADGFFFIQVGAYDGVCVDPVVRLRQKLHWHGIMIEPCPASFALLAKNMSGQPQIELLQVALSDREGAVPFYTVDPEAPGAPTKAPLISSLSRETLLRELDPAIDWSPWIRETMVPCTTLDSILGQRNVTRLDLLQIDAEGHDARILRALDFERWRPRIINFEHALLAPAEADACWSTLVAQGYLLHVSAPDTIAVHQSVM